MQSYSFQSSGDLENLSPAIKKACVYGSFKEHLLHHTRFREYCVAAINTTHEPSYLYFLELTNERENDIFNIFCQKIMTHLLLCLERAISFDNRNLKSSFWYNVHEFLGSPTSTEIIRTLPAQMHDRILFASITLFSDTL